eukprot:g7451.t1
MDIGKRMMEKWGWAKGQGLGKDNKGMTSCLVLRKDSGSSTQGRIESVGEEPTLAHEARVKLGMNFRNRGHSPLFR